MTVTTTAALASRLPAPLRRSRPARKLWRAKNQLAARRRIIGLSGRKRQAYPTDIEIGMTSRCVSNCLYCGRRQIMDRGLRKPIDAPWSRITRIIEQCGQLADEHPDDEFQICPNGLGEALLHPRLFDAIRLIREAVPRAHIHMNTNAVLLDQDKAHAILSSELDHFIVSLNVWDRADYQALHYADRFEQVKQNAEELFATAPLYHKRPRLSIQILDIGLNQASIEDFKAHWLRLGADNVYVRPFIPLSWTIRTLMEPDAFSDYRYLLGPEDAALPSKRWPCTSLFKLCSISTEGEIYPCNFALWHGEGLSLGNIDEISIAEAYRANIPFIREAHTRSRWGEIPACSACNFWCAMPNLFHRIPGTGRWI